MKPTLKRIVINKHHIKWNITHPGQEKPVISVQSRGRVCYANKVWVKGESTVCYSPEKPLKCGASVWIETYADVIIEHD